jgi:hypothetical protein
LWREDESVIWTTDKLEAGSLAMKVTVVGGPAISELRKPNSLKITTEDRVT